MANALYGNNYRGPIKYNEDIISRISSQQERQLNRRQRQEEEHLSQIRDSRLKQLEQEIKTKEELYKKDKKALSELNAEYQKQRSIIADNYQQEIRTLKLRQVAEQEANQGLIKDLQIRAEHEKEILETAKKTVSEKKQQALTERDAASNAIALNNALIKQNNTRADEIKQKLAHKALDDEEYKHLQEQTGLLMQQNALAKEKLKSSRESYEQAVAGERHLKEFERSMTPATLPEQLKRIVKNKQDDAEELKKYATDKSVLEERRRIGDLSDSDYQKLVKQLLDGLSQSNADLVDKLEAEGKDTNDIYGEGVKQTMWQKLADSVINAIDKLGDKLDSAVDNAVNVYTTYNAKTTARLYGDSDNLTFTDLVEDIRNDVKASPYVKQTDLIAKVAELADAGIDYNIEQRALLLTLSDKLVPTFEALDGTLTRMVRLQQADVTLSQMGSEASLLKILNNVFKDSSYLNTLYDSVASALTDALSTQTDTDQYTQFGFSVQKWLGGLYSVGLSDSAVSSIASAINLLATGDLSQLNDSSAQTLLALSANKAGLSYASMLTEGVTADDTNKLLKSMIEYLRDIATNTNSNVVKSQWGDIFNMEMSDWKALQNITDSDISTLYNATVTQQTATEEITNMMTELLPSRYHLSEQISNALDNAIFSFGMGIADDSEKYAGWKIIQKVKDIGETFLGESTLLNLLAGVVSLGAFSEDLLSIPSNLWSALSSGDSSIANILSNYQISMDRGGVSNTSSSNNSVITGTSTSKSITVSPTNSDYDLYDEDLDYIENYGITGDTISMSIQTVGTSSSDMGYTTFAQQDEYQSATAQNIVSSDTVLTRDINDLYAELFERQTTPIRVSLAKVEPQGQTDLHVPMIDNISNQLSGSINVSVDSGVMSSLYAMHSYA